MKIFITGGSGFIGRNLKEQLACRYQIFAPGHEELDLLDAAKVSAYLRQNHFDIVIHAATWCATRNSKKDVTKVLENNLRMFFNLFRCARSYDRMIYFGSGEEYGRENWMPRMDEGYFDQAVPLDQSGLSKYIVTQFVERVDNIVNLRSLAVFGKYEDWEIRFISNACCKAMYDLPITIKKNAVFDYLYIDDLVKITEWFIKNQPREKVYNVCTGQTHDLLTLAAKVLRVCGKDLPIKVAEPGYQKEYSGDNSRLLGAIGGFRFQDIDESIAELYRWYEARKQDIPRELLSRDK